VLNVQVLKYVEVLPHAVDVNVNVKYAFEDATEISVINKQIPTWTSEFDKYIKPLA